MNVDFNSEALEVGIKPNKPVKNMTEEERKEFRTSVNSDDMGFLGKESGADE